jgi:formylglycine-generating enzyme required for sulfatase activity
MSRFARSVGLGLLGAVTYLSAGDLAHAKDCKPGKLNAMATCDCPPGYASSGPAGDAVCRSLGCVGPNCGGGGGGGEKLPGDAGSSVPVPAGSFMMGDTTSPGASPVRQVSVGAFAIDRYEVSVEEYEKCVKTGVCSAPPASFLATASRCNYGTKRTAHPMNCVTYQEATNYCLWKSKRLPTEAEWEFAARGKGSSLYPWGSDAPSCKQANWTEKSPATKYCGDGTSPIGNKPAGKSAFGAHDMAGNVEEWVFDWYGTWKSGSATDPGGPLTGTSRVVKGSAFDLTAQTEHVAARREGVDPTKRETWLGFRCATGPSPNATPAYYLSPLPTTTTTTTTTPPPVGPSDLGSMVKVPGGTFTMGGVGETADAMPTHPVTLAGFSIDKYEVTVGEYRKCVGSGACLVPANTLSPNCNYDKTGKDFHPVNCVDWNDAKKFCGWAGKRLPTEAEWEYAARGVDNRSFPWGDKAPSCSMADYKSDAGTFCSGSGTSPVGKHPLGISYWGVHDLAGNIEEWVFDYWGKYGASPLVNPTGPFSGGDHVTRGGNWELESKYLKTFSRWHAKDANYWTGFRCAKSGS